MLNSNIWKDKVGIPMFESIWSELQCLEGYGQISNVWKDVVSTFQSVKFPG